MAANPATLICAVSFGLIFFLSCMEKAVSLSNIQKTTTLRLKIITVVECILSFCSLYVWNKYKPFISASNVGIIAQKFTKIVLLSLFTLAQLSFLLRIFFAREPTWLAKVCYSCLGVLVQLLACNIVLDLLQSFFQITAAVLRYVMGENVQNPQDPRQKSVAQKRKILFATFCAVLLSVHGIYKATLEPSIKHISVPVKGLTPSMDGLRIVQICDVHIGSTVGVSKVQTLANTVNNLSPDILVIVGDLLDGHYDSLAKEVLPLKQIQTRLGKYFVTGNHEYISGDVDSWFEALEALDIHILHNSHVEMKHANSPVAFYLAGVDDLQASRMGYKGHGMNLDLALRGCDPSVPVILLAHQPQAAKLALQDDKHNIQLVLSGHTHGGQMFPMTIIANLFNPFFSGLYHFHGASVYVSQGTVYWGIPMRTFSTAEITVIELRAYAAKT